MAALPRGRGIACRLVYDGIPFEKWQGLGNHYVVTESAHWPFAITPDRAVQVCDPNFGVGADGILEVVTSGSLPEMRVWNPDGSMAENCGNGIRMVSRYLALNGLLPADGRVLTGAGEVRVQVDGSVVAVEMGRAVFPAGEGEEPLSTEAGEFALAEVSMGNPHAVIRHDDPDAVVDIEFVAQMLQLVHGGREPGLRINGTLPALVALHEAGLLGNERFAFLERAYRTLRAIEGRLRLIDAVARHDFPESGDERRKLAHLLGYVDTESLVADVRDTTSRVRAEFNAVIDEAMANT